MDNAKYLFSVIIPTLNEEKCLPLLLEDLVQQTSKDFETIIVDARSVDNTREKALFFREKLNLTVLTGKEKNISAQKNYGAGKANGKYLIFIDADVRIEPNFLAGVARCVDNKDSLILPYLRPDDNSPVIKGMFFLGNILILLSQYSPKPLSSAGCIIIKKELFGKLKGFDNELYNAEDHDLITRAHKKGVRGAVKFNIRVMPSLRRVRKEGWIRAMGRMMLTALYIFWKGKIKKKIFDYEMGGRAHVKN